MARKDLQNLKKRLDTLQSFKSANADPEWKYTFRQSLLIKVKTQSMAKIYEQKIAEDLGFFGFIKSWQPKPAMMPATIFSIVLFVFFGLSFGTVWASRGSLPGDVLFPVKLAVEKTQLATKNKPNEKTKFQVEITNRRATEIVKLAVINEESRGEKSEKIEQAVFELKHQLNEIKSDLTKIQENSSQQDATKTAKEVCEKLLLVEQSLNRAENNLAEDNNKLAEKIDSASDLVDIASNEALTVMAKALEKNDQDEDNLSKDEIVQQVEAKIAKTEEKIKSISAKVGDSLQVNADLAKEQSEKAQEILDKAKDSLEDEDILEAIETIKVAKEIVMGASNIASDIDSSETESLPVEEDKNSEQPAQEQEEKNTENNSVDGGQKEEDDQIEPQPALEGVTEPDQTPSASLQLTKS